MRIIGYIDHPHLKITVFKMDTRFSVKFEIGSLEQTFKFGQQNGLETLPEIRHLIDAEFVKGVEEIFRQMETIHQATLSRHIPKETFDEFEDII